jgi:hypothetical protein
MLPFVEVGLSFKNLKANTSLAREEVWHVAVRKVKTESHAGLPRIWELDNQLIEVQNVNLCTRVLLYKVGNNEGKSPRPWHSGPRSE